MKNYRPEIARENPDDYSDTDESYHLNLNINENSDPNKSGLDLKLNVISRPTSKRPSSKKIDGKSASKTKCIDNILIFLNLSEY